MRQEINISLVLTDGCPLNDVQAIQLKIFVDQFKERLEHAGIKVNEATLTTERKSPETRRASIHAPTCSGAWCDGDCQ